MEAPFLERPRKYEKPALEKSSRDATLRSNRMLKNAEIPASSFDRLRMRWSDFNGLDLMVSLSNHGPHPFFSSLLEAAKISRAELGGNLRDAPPLEEGSSKLVLRRLTRAIAASNRGGAIR